MDRRLIEAWRRWGGKALHFASVKNHSEDEQTVIYLRRRICAAGRSDQQIYAQSQRVL